MGHVRDFRSPGVRTEVEIRASGRYSLWMPHPTADPRTAAPADRATGDDRRSHTGLRIFLTCWIVYSLFFATNVVREHYPAFSLIERGDWVCDDYAGFHADLFEHTDGHWYVGNNLLGSLIAVPPLLLFDPVLDALQRRSLAKLAESDEPPDATYDTKYPLRQELFRKVKLAGLDLRFGASTAITSALLMAPLSALLAVLVFGLLRERGVERRRSLWMTWLFAFGTPVFFRTAHLNHNMFLMEALFGAFLLLWRRPGNPEPLSLGRRLAAGFLCGMAMALDYAGFVPAGILALYFVCTRAGTSDWPTALREAVPCVLAALPPLAFLLGTQWAMYGDPFTPGQFVMREVNYTDRGLKGMGLPKLEIFLKNLLSPSYGMLVFAPVLALGFVPLAFGRRGEGEPILPGRERRWTALYVLGFLLFCAANWYSLMQFNTGFRYLLPVVPFVFLAASDHLARLPRGWLVALTVASIAHQGVLSMAREVNDTEKQLRDRAEALGAPETELEGYWRTLLTETPVPVAYRRLVSEGPQLPWLTVLRQTSPGRAGFLGSPFLVLGLFALAGGLICGVWAVRALGRPRVRPGPP